MKTRKQEARDRAEADHEIFNKIQPVFKSKTWYGKKNMMRINEDYISQRKQSPGLKTNIVIALLSHSDGS